MNRALLVVAAIGLVGLVAFAAYSWGRRAGQQPAPMLGTALTPQKYSNLEEVELLDFDPVLLMPRRIRIHRDAEMR